MKFFCPSCQAAIPIDSDASRATCPGCGLNVDLALVDTSAGRPQLPVVWDHTGERIGPYLLSACLGSGGMGTVYKAVDTRDDRVVALKLLFPHLVVMENVLARFRREARALKELVHPRIVGYVDEGQADGHHYLAMEYVEGESLDAYLRRQTPTPEKAIEIATQIAQALRAAHDKGVVHRDLKPANVILSPDGVRVLDFGIAHMTCDEHTLTHSDAILGTVNYMSPEQRASVRRVDHRSDLYSLGVILYRMWTGRLPLGVFEPVSRRHPRLGRGHDRLLFKALQSDPERRHQSVQELLGELARLARPAGGPLYWVPAAVLAVGLGIGGYAVWSRYAGSHRPEKAPPKKAAAALGKAKTVNMPAPEKKEAPLGKTAGLATSAVRDEKPTARIPLEQEPEKKKPATKKEKITADAPRSKKGEKEKIESAAKKRSPAAKKKRRAKKRAKAESPPKVLIAPEHGIPIYKMPGKSGKPLFFLTKGDKLRVLKRLKGKDGRIWLHLKTSTGEQGWVPRHLIE